MTEKEIKILSEYMDISEIYFEFGSGGSTDLAINKKNIKKIYSVDTDEKWLDKFNNDKLKKIYIDVGPVGKLGVPLNNNKKQNWELYSRSINDIIDIPDLILIDGRFRVACGLQSWLKITNKTNVIIHDFKKRKNYHILLEFYNVIKSENQLIVLNKKNTKLDVNKIYEKYKYEIK